MNEICEILRIFKKFGKECNFLNTIIRFQQNRIKLFLSLNGKPRQNNSKNNTCRVSDANNNPAKSCVISYQALLPGFCLQSQ